MKSELLLSDQMLTDRDLICELKPDLRVLNGGSVIESHHITSVLPHEQGREGSRTRITFLRSRRTGHQTSSSQWGVYFMNIIK